MFFVIWKSSCGFTILEDVLYVLFLGWCRIHRNRSTTPLECGTVHTVTNVKENSNQSEEGQETEACWQVEQQIYQPVCPYCTQERTYHIKAGAFISTRL